MLYKLHKPDQSLTGRIQLPRSKSISNRLLIIQALSDTDFAIQGLSEAEDTRILRDALQKDSKIINAAAGGTTFRFLTAYYALTQQKKILTGTQRMKERPIGILVNALRQLGARITYLGREGYPPLKLQGGDLRGKAINIDTSVSSQFVSALLLIAPLIPEGIRLCLTDNPVSTPYIQMTLALMQQMGVDYQWKDSVINVPGQSYTPVPITVEPDWSAASYFFTMAAFADQVDLVIEELSSQSIQGDQIIAELMTSFGVNTQYQGDGAHLSKTKQLWPETVSYNFTDYPDIAPALIVACAGCGVKATFTGMEHLQLKESNRVRVIQEELQKLGWKLSETGKAYQLQSTGHKVKQGKAVYLNPHKDHRIAMALSCWALLQDELHIEEPGVVSKSFPHFWKMLKQVGVKLTRAPSHTSISS